MTGRGLRVLAGAGVLALLAACAAQQETAPTDEPPQASTQQPETLPPADDTVERAIEVPEELELMPPEADGPPHRVGLLLPLSGPQANLGESMLRAAQLALFDVADDEFALIVRDTEGTREGAAAAAESAISAGANLLLGPVFSHSVEAVAPVAQGGQVPVIAFSNDRSVAQPGIYVTGLLPGEQVDRIVGYAADQGNTDFALLAPDNAFGDRIAQAMQDAVRKHGVYLVKAQSFPPGANDISEPVKQLAEYQRREQELEQRIRELKSQSSAQAKQELDQLKNLDALGKAPFDAVLLPMGGSRLRALAPTLPFYDIDPEEVQFLGTAQWNDPALGTEPALQGGWFPAPPANSLDRFAERYRKTYDESAGSLEALAYDATALAGLLARQAVQNETPPAQVYTTEALTQGSGFAGANGLFRLTPNGLIERRYSVMQVERDGLTVLDEAPSTFAGPTN